MSLRVLFLDFSGVLDCFPKRWELPKPGERLLPLPLHMFVPEAVARVAEIVRRTDARIVVSSSLRLFSTLPELRKQLNESGYPARCPIIGKTPRGWAGFRGYEIQGWLTAAYRRGWNVESFCILDDDDDMAHLLPRLVQTDKDQGLQQEDVERAVAMLNK